MKYRILISITVLSIFCGCFDCPTNSESVQSEYFLTTVFGNGQTALRNRNDLYANGITFRLLVTNRHGVPIQKCRIDWTVIEGSGDFSTGIESREDIFTNNTDSNGVSQGYVYPNNIGIIKVRAKVFVTGEYVDFVATIQETK